MNQTTGRLAGIAFACLITGATHAASIQSMTIEEIGPLSGGLGSSSEQSGGGYISAYSALGASFGSASFVSQGSADGALLMGEMQGPDDFSSGFLWSTQTAYLNTLNGAPSGTITDNVMTLDLSGFGGEWNNLSFNGAPDPGTLMTSVSLIGNGVYFYTADWIHLVTASDNLPAMYYGATFDLHLEGIAITTPVPEPETYAMLLAGLGIVCAIAPRRRKSA